VIVPQRRDVVVLLATGPSSATAVPRQPGTASQAPPGETNYVYYTTIPRLCAVTTSTGNVVLPTSSGTLWTPVRGRVTPGSGEVSSGASAKHAGEAKPAAAVVFSTAWTPSAVVGGPRDVAPRAAAASTNHCGRTSTAPIRVKAETVATVVATTPNPPATKSLSPTALDSSAADGVEVIASSTTSRTFTCSECNRDFASEKYLNMHMSLHFQSLASPRAATNEAAAAASPCVHGGTPDVSTPGAMVLAAQQQLMMAPPPIRRTKTTMSGMGGGTSCTSQWTCQICEKTFAQNSNYKNHIRTHSNERPFVCEICAIGYFAIYFLL